MLEKFVTKIESLRTSTALYNMTNVYRKVEHKLR